MHTARSSSCLGGSPPLPQEQALPGAGTPQEQAPPRAETLTHATENTTLPQTSFGGGNNTAIILLRAANEVVGR